MKKVLLFNFLIIFFFTACRKDFIQSDLTGKRIAMLAPADEDTVSTTTPLFWWNELQGTRYYHLQIVYPDFDAPQTLVYDTLIESDRFYPTLSPGATYHWRIRPENSVYTGDWLTRSITIDSTVSLNAQTVAITSPTSNGFSTSNGTISFTWNSLSGAALYRIDITNTTSGSNIITTTGAANSFSYTFPQGNYSFSVRAENTNSFTPWSMRTFTIDQTAPVAPQLISPANTTFYATPPSFVNFDWSSAADAVTDSLYISTDSSFTTGIQAALLFNSAQSNYAWPGAQPATIYYWRVRSTDAAGNRSSYSDTYSFTDN